VTAPAFFLPDKARQNCFLQGHRLRDSEGTYEPVLFQFVSCVFQFHPFEGRGFPADSIIRRVKSRVVLDLQNLNCAFQILTAYATHFAPLFRSVGAEYELALHMRA
jgi:hypothetical protein